MTLSSWFPVDLPTTVPINNLISHNPHITRGEEDAAIDCSIHQVLVSKSWRSGERKSNLIAMLLYTLSHHWPIVKYKAKFLLSCGACLFSFVLATSLMGQVRIDYSAATNGLILPIADTSTVTNLSPGIIVFSNLDSMLYLYDGVRFQQLGFTGEISSLNDEDMDTRIEVEKYSDENIIRFTIEGVERIRMIGDRLEMGTGDGNLYIGNQAGQSYTSGDDNTLVGISAGRDLISASENTFIGADAGRDHQEGRENTAIGSEAMLLDTSGMRNTAVGAYSLPVCLSCQYNNTLGFSALSNLQSGNHNLALGSRTMGMKTSGSENIAIGSSAGYNNIIGSNNILIGDSAGFNETGSEKLYIDGSSNGSSTPLIYGDFDTDLLQVNGDFNVFGKTIFNPDVTSRDIIIENKVDFINEPFIHPSDSNFGFIGDENFYFFKTYSSFFFAQTSGNYQTFSDKRLKKDIARLSSGMKVISKLQPVSYKLIKEESKVKRSSPKINYGLIAQDVEKILPSIVHTHPSGMKSVGYQAIIPFLIKGMQEQQTTIEEILEENGILKKLLAENNLVQHDLIERIIKLENK